MLKKNLPVILLRGLILLPNNDIRLEFDNDISRNIIDVAEMFHDNELLVVSTKDYSEDLPRIEDLPHIGVISKVTHKMELPNGKTRVIIEGDRRANVCEYLNLNHANDVLESIIEDIEEIRISEEDEEINLRKLNYEIKNYVKNIPYISNIYNHTLMFKDGRIYAAREGEAYSNFFDTIQPYWMTLVCDGITSDGNAFPADKVFNNIEYRADCFNPNGIDSVINEPVFDKKAAWNGYQMYKEFDIDAVRKFNTWRVQLPRATYNINGVLTTTRDRIRNPFCYIKLINRNRRITDRMIIHDLAVYFDIK
jgi:hypothetical protein